MVKFSTTSLSYDLFRVVRHGTRLYEKSFNIVEYNELINKFNRVVKDKDDRDLILENISLVRQVYTFNEMMKNPNTRNTNGYAMKDILQKIRVTQRYTAAMLKIPEATFKSFLNNKLPMQQEIILKLKQWKIFRDLLKVTIQSADIPLIHSDDHFFNTPLERVGHSVGGECIREHCERIDMLVHKSQAILLMEPINPIFDEMEDGVTLKNIFLRYMMSVEPVYGKFDEIVGRLPSLKTKILCISAVLWMKKGEIDKWMNLEDNVRDIVDCFGVSLTCKRLMLKAIFEDEAASTELMETIKHTIREDSLSNDLNEIWMVVYSTFKMWRALVRPAAAAARPSYRPAMNNGYGVGCIVVSN
jgi:hypothetical protein